MKGYSQDLYILAFDHRGTITKGLLGVEGREPTEDESNKVNEMKNIIFDGFLKAKESGITGGDPAILVDETFGLDVQQKKWGLNLPPQLKNRAKKFSILNTEINLVKKLMKLMLIS
jgi:myo-inositol catabolism protein IolC